MQDKIIMYSIIGVAALAIILVGLLMYSKQLSDEVEEGTMTLEQMSNANNQTNTNTESVSTDIGKSVEEAKNEINNTNTSTNVTNTNTNIQNSTNTTSSNNTTKQNTTTKQTTTASNKKQTEKKEETKKELSFQKPVDGEIMKGYAKDNLVYSETLQEWTTHLGIDIKAEKTTVVKAAEAGTVKTIKNDPRYGLTITIEHGDGYQTVYSNLLSSEFVVEGEKVEKDKVLELLEILLHLKSLMKHIYILKY